jgi:hypothetical protein
VGIVALAAGITGFLFQRFGMSARIAALTAAALLLAPHKFQIGADDPAFNTPRIVITVVGGLLLIAVAIANRRAAAHS